MIKIKFVASTKKCQIILSYIFIPYLKITNDESAHFCKYLLIKKQLKFASNWKEIIKLSLFQPCANAVDWKSARSTTGNDVINEMENPPPLSLCIISGRGLSSLRFSLIQLSIEYIYIYPQMLIFKAIFIPSFPVINPFEENGKAEKNIRFFTIHSFSAHFTEKWRSLIVEIT